MVLQLSHHHMNLLQKFSAALKTLAPVRQLQLGTVAIPLGKINKKWPFKHCLGINFR